MERSGRRAEIDAESAMHAVALKLDAALLARRSLALLHRLSGVTVGAGVRCGGSTGWEKQGNYESAQDHQYGQDYYTVHYIKTRFLLPSVHG